MSTRHCGRHLANNTEEHDNNNDINEKTGCINPY